MVYAEVTMTDGRHHTHDAESGAGASRYILTREQPVVTVRLLFGDEHVGLVMRSNPGRLRDFVQRSVTEFLDSES